VSVLTPHAAGSIIARLLLLAGTLALGACATAPGPVPAGAALGRWLDRQQRLAALVQWNLQGRVGIETGKDSGNATMSWEQNGEEYAIRISAPLSQGTFELKGGMQGVTLRGPDNRVASAADPQALMQDQLGWSLPVAGLKYWIRGIPMPNRPVAAVHFDDAGRLSDLEQDGWRVSVQRYKKVGGEELPDKIFMENAPLKMRVVIGEWQLF
jgi:outer membrane lipoprotein LolB